MNNRMVIALLLLFATSVSAQTATSSSRPVVVRGTGTAPGRPPMTEPPTPLSAAAKAAILKSLSLAAPGTLYFKVTPNQSYEAGKGWIGFSNSYLVGGTADFAEFAPPKDEKHKFADINIKSEAKGRKYLVDCYVTHGIGGKGPYKLWRGDELLQTWDEHTHDLIFLVETLDNGWYTLRMTGEPVWLLKSCEVTRF